MYEDKTLVCKECGKEFVFTAGEQEFYAERGFQNEPQRCKSCRDARKNAARGPREFFTATCAACGGEARVPFEPKSDRPVYCSECFAKMREQRYRNGKKSINDTLKVPVMTSHCWCFFLCPKERNQQGNICVPKNDKEMKNRIRRRWAACGKRKPLLKNEQRGSF